MIRYVFDEDQPLRIKNAKAADAQKLGEALAEISAKHAGRLRPEDVVAAASDPASPLNQHFEWDNEAAASAYRLDQARSVIRVIRVAEGGNEEPKRAFISIGDDVGRAYRAAAEVATSVDLQARLLAQADRELEAFEKRYRSLTVLCEAVRDVREKLRRQQASKENRPAN